MFDPNNNLLFSGDNYKPSLLYKSIDCVEAVVGGLSFLTLQEGATDEEYFSKYTPLQIEFRDSNQCEDLNTLINDFESGAWTAKDDEIGQEYYSAAKLYFETHYFQDIAEYKTFISNNPIK